MTSRLVLRVRYAETDQMGVAHHANYLVWMEAARTELMREHGLSYRDLEERGYLLPVREAVCRYRRALRYDDVAVVEARILELGGASIRIGYRILLEGDGSLAAEGYTLHPFTDRSHRVVRVPGFFRRLFSEG
jgi:acyl-CoA thioester hydrolase